MRSRLVIFGKFPRFACVLLFAGLSLGAIQGEESSLPFSIKITEEKMDKLPDYTKEPR